MDPGRDLRLVSTASPRLRLHLGTFADPHCVELALGIGALVGERAEEIALTLAQRGR